jgi:hypothetical protein
MAIPDQVLNLMKCCFSNDGHIAIEPIPVSCGATAQALEKKCNINEHQRIINDGKGS